MFAILSAFCFAYFFYSIGHARGWKAGRRYHEERAEEMLRSEQLKTILDNDQPPVVAQRQPLRSFGSTRPDIKRVK